MMPDRSYCFCLANYIRAGPKGRGVSLATLNRHVAADREAARVLEIGGYVVDQELLIETTERRRRVAGDVSRAGEEQADLTGANGACSSR